MGGVSCDEGSCSLARRGTAGGVLSKCKEHHRLQHALAHTHTHELALAYAPTRTHTHVRTCMHTPPLYTQTTGAASGRGHDDARRMQKELQRV